MKRLGNHHGNPHSFLLLPLLAIFSTSLLIVSRAAQPPARQDAVGEISPKNKATGNRSGQRTVKKATKPDPTTRPGKPRGPRAKIESRVLPRTSPPAPRASYAGHELYEKLLPSSVQIVIDHSGDFSRYVTGTGWVVDEDEKLIVTNQHVVSKEDSSLAKDAEIRVYFPETDNGKLITDQAYCVRPETACKATVIDADALRDLAILQLERLGPSAKALQLASEGVQPGDRQPPDRARQPGRARFLLGRAVGSGICQGQPNDLQPPQVVPDQ